MRLLVFSSLFPNQQEPHHGVFVKARLLRYLARHGGSASVIAPVPLSPPIGPWRWTRYRHIARREHVDGLPVLHPRFPSPPGFGDRWRAGLMARAVRGCMVDWAKATEPDVLDAHYAFPDSVAAWRLRTELEQTLGRRVPLVITCRGTDLNLVPQIDGLRPQVAEALCGADHVICVAEALRQVALELGVPEDRVSTLRNGVDLEHFRPGDQAAARRAVDLPGDCRIVLCVGHLIERKGQQLLIPAFARQFAKAPYPHLLVCVGGGDPGPLRRLAEAEGVDHLVRFTGPVSPEVLPDYYRAADVQVLASSREGWPNVVLEGLACGLPIVATRVWGTPEILDGCPAGLLVDPTVDGLASGLGALDELHADAARPWAERFGWEATVDGMHAVFESVTAA